MSGPAEAASSVSRLASARSHNLGSNTKETGRGGGTGGGGIREVNLKYKEMWSQVEKVKKNFDFDIQQPRFRERAPDVQRKLRELRTEISG